MDNTSTKFTTEPAVTSRLPAGSTFEVSPGVHVPHPNAEVNLPGIGDPRLGNDAQTEVVQISIEKGEKPEEEHLYAKATVVQKPLADEVKPKVVTVNEKAKPSEADASAVAATQTAETDGAKLAVELPTLHKTE